LGSKLPEKSESQSDLTLHPIGDASTKVEAPLCF